jgi:hypothetical protein
MESGGDRAAPTFCGMISVKADSTGQNGGVWPINE